MHKLIRFALVAFFPRVDDLPGLDELGVDEKIIALRRDATRLFWIGLVAAALFFQLTPLLTVRRPLLAVLLSDDQLDEHAHRLASHPVYLIRQLIVLLKLVGGLFWAQSSEIRASLALPAYPVDPATRRTEAFVGRPALGARAPVEALVKLGRRELERGRDPASTGADVGRVA